MLVDRRALLSSIAALGVFPTLPVMAKSGRSPKCFFVSNEGNDRNDGLKTSSPLKSLKALSQITISPGDRIYFRRGDVFYGKFELNGALQSAGGDKIFCGAYGFGEMPTISGFKVLRPGCWQRHSADVWKIGINDISQIEGNITTTGSDGANIGFLKIDGLILGNKVNCVENLEADLDFFSDQEREDFLYIRTSANPGMRFQTILAAPRVDPLLPRRSNFEIRDIQAIGTGGHHFEFIGNSDVEIFNCHLADFGGSYLFDPKGPVRYGNGIQFWVNCYRIRVKNVFICNGYDVAITCQGFPINNVGDGWQDILFENIVIYGCNQDIEFWNQIDSTGIVPTHSPPLSGLREVRIYGIRSYHTGNGWSAPVRIDKNVGCNILMYRLQAPIFDVMISNCRFDSRYVNSIIYSPRSQIIPSGLKMLNNTWICRRHTRVYSNSAHTVLNLKLFDYIFSIDRSNKFLITGYGH